MGNKEEVNVLGIAKNLAELHNIPRLTANTIVQSVFDEIVSLIIGGKKVAINKFGTFETVTKEAHTALNPRTHEKISVPTHDVFKFKLAPTLRKKITDTTTVK